MSARLFILFYSLILCGKNFGITTFPTRDIQYQVFENKLTWDDANEYCRDKNLTLAIILNETDMANVRGAVSRKKLSRYGYSAYWVGGRADGRIWRWDFGARSITFDGWHIGEPDHVEIVEGNPEACLAMEYSLSDGSLAWNDRWCNGKIAFICQNYD